MFKQTFSRVWFKYVALRCPQTEGRIRCLKALRWPPKAEYVALRCEGGPKVGPYKPRAAVLAPSKGRPPVQCGLRWAKSRNVLLRFRSETARAQGRRGVGGRKPPPHRWSNTPDRGSADFSSKLGLILTSFLTFFYDFPAPHTDLAKPCFLTTVRCFGMVLHIGKTRFFMIFLILFATCFCIDF